MIFVCLGAMLGAGCSLFPDMNENSYRTENATPTAEAGSFSAEKYKTEPTVKVWFADTGEVKSMPLETYLEGVVAQEMITDFPLEALAAQAICSRTIAINAIEAGTIKKLHNADVSTSKDELQAYDAKKVTLTDCGAEYSAHRSSDHHNPSIFDCAFLHSTFCKSL